MTHSTTYSSTRTHSSTVSLAWGIALTILLSACGGSSDEEGGGGGSGGGGPSGQSGGDLFLTLESRKTEAPSSEVSISFFVSARDGTPVPGLPASDFAILENGVPNSTFESSKRIELDERNFVVYSLLLLDLSDSIRRSGALPELLDSAQELVSAVFESDSGDVHRMAVFWFDGSEDINLATDGFSGDPEAINAAINGLPGSADRSTNLHGAVVRALETIQGKLDSTDEETIRRGSLVTFTDGTDNAFRVLFDQLNRSLNRYVGRPKDDKDISSFSIGLGGEIDEEVLLAIAGGIQEHVVIANQVSGDPENTDPDRTTLQEAFLGVADLIEEEANSFYLLKYCSPKRAGTHDLTIELDIAEGAGFLSTRFNADGFSPECSVEFLDVTAEVAGGPGVDIASAITTGEDGSVFVAGRHGGSLSGEIRFDPPEGTDDANPAPERAFLARLGSDDGWEVPLGDDSTDVQVQAIASRLGQIYVAGTFTGNPAILEGTGAVSSSPRAFLAFVEASTGRITGASIGEGGGLSVSDVAVSERDGSIFVTGSFRGSLTFGSLGPIDAQGSDGFVVR
ncbi:MAG: VWA domain-containing protein, partial [Planctomycetota bacterium]